MSPGGPTLPTAPQTTDSAFWVHTWPFIRIRLSQGSTSLWARTGRPASRQRTQPVLQERLEALSPHLAREAPQGTSLRGKRLPPALVAGEVPPGTVTPEVIAALRPPFPESWPGPFNLPKQSSVTPSVLHGAHSCPSRPPRKQPQPLGRSQASHGAVTSGSVTGQRAQGGSAPWGRSQSQLPAWDGATWANVGSRKKLMAATYIRES